MATSKHWFISFNIATIQSKDKDHQTKAFSTDQIHLSRLRLANVKTVYRTR